MKIPHPYNQITSAAIPIKNSTHEGNKFSLWPITWIAYLSLELCYFISDCNTHTLQLLVWISPPPKLLIVLTFLYCRAMGLIKWVGLKQFNDLCIHICIKQMWLVSLGVICDLFSVVSYCIYIRDKFCKWFYNNNGLTYDVI